LHAVRRAALAGDVRRPPLGRRPRDRPGVGGRGVERSRVLRRTASPEPLEHQGTVEADDDAAAAAAALKRYGDRWVELVLVPERAVHWVVGGDCARRHRPGGGEPPAGPGRQQVLAGPGAGG